MAASGGPRSGADPQIKNRTFMQLKRELHLREKSQKHSRNKGDQHVDSYVDRDRAAAIAVGNKDIKRALSHHRRFEGRSANRSMLALLPSDTSSLDKFMMLGRNELKWGDAEKALMYFEKSCALNREKPDKAAVDFQPYLQRSRCRAKLFQFDLALLDADQALRIQPTSRQAIMAKAEALYHSGYFEHALIYYYRADRIRPGRHEVRQGIAKAITAIDNCLTKMSHDMPVILSQMHQMGLVMVLTEPEHVHVQHQDADQPDPELFLRRFFAPSRCDSSAQKETEDAGYTKDCPDRISLDNMHRDRRFLKRLSANPSLNHGQDHVGQCVRQALQYIEARKQFWHEQDPARIVRKAPASNMTTNDLINRN